MRKILGAVLCVVLCDIAGAGHRREEVRCSERMDRLAARTLWIGREPLVLPPGERRYLIGSLAKTEHGKYLLAIGGYRTRHSHLHLALEAAADDEGLGQFGYRWLGELELVNDRRFRTVGEIKRVTPVAGYWATVLHGLIGNSNDVENLTDVLWNRYDELLHPSYRALSYRDAVRNGELHLMKRLRKYLKQFEKLLAQGQIPAWETYRHYIGNRINVLLTQIQHILRPESTMTRAQKLAAIRETLEPPLSLESVYLYLTWLENDGFTEPSIAAMKDLLKRFDRDGRLSLNDWVNFNTLGTWLLSFVFGSARNDVTLEEWMAFGGVGADFLSLVGAASDEHGASAETHILVLDR